MLLHSLLFCFFKQKTAYEMRISDWSSDVCSSDLLGGGLGIRYNDETPPDPRAYAELVRKHIAPLGCEIALEPGRYLVGNAGLLLTRVTYEIGRASCRERVCQYV